MKLGCDHCKGEREPGFIEMRNNGPIVACPVCNGDYDSPSQVREREFEAAEAQRRREQRAARRIFTFT